MRILVRREERTEFAASFAFDKRPGDVLALPANAVRLFERLDDEGAHGRARLRGPMAQLIVQRLWDIYSGAYSHGFIMAPAT
jgi:hypothetical protein